MTGAGQACLVCNGRGWVDGALDMESCRPCLGSGIDLDSLPRVERHVERPVVVAPEPEWSPYPWPYGWHRDYYDRCYRDEAA